MTQPNDVIAILAEWFPSAFVVYEARRKPLAIGIRRAILERTGGAIEPQELARALRLYVANIGYLLASMQPGAIRVDLEGQPTGVVTPEHAETARLRLVKRKAPKRLVPAPARVEPPRIQPSIKRASLTDLRNAAQARRSAA